MSFYLLLRLPFDSSTTYFILPYFPVHILKHFRRITFGNKLQFSLSKYNVLPAKVKLGRKTLFRAISIGEREASHWFALQKQSWETFKKWGETGHGTSVFTIDFQRKTNLAYIFMKGSFSTWSKSSQLRLLPSHRDQDRSPIFLDDISMKWFFYT